MLAQTAHVYHHTARYRACMVLIAPVGASHASGMATPLIYNTLQIRDNRTFSSYLPSLIFSNCRLITRSFQLDGFFLLLKKGNPLPIQRCRYSEKELPPASSSTPNSKPQQEQMTYVGHPNSSYGGSSNLS